MARWGLPSPPQYLEGKKPPIWFALNQSRPLAFYPGIWVRQWKSVRKMKEGMI
jgi:hypothetical protein